MNFLDELLLPSYQDSVTGNRNHMEYGDIKYLPKCMQLNYMITVGLDLADSQKRTRHECLYWICRQYICF